MPATVSSSSIGVPTLFLQAGDQTYAYRRLGEGSAPPLLFLQHCTGTLDNWDPAVADPLALDREIILFENAGIGRSTGVVPNSIAGMAQHVLRFLGHTGPCSNFTSPSHGRRQRSLRRTLDMRPTEVTAILLPRRDCVQLPETCGQHSLGSGHDVSETRKTA